VGWLGFGSDMPKVPYLCIDQRIITNFGLPIARKNLHINSKFILDMGKWTGTAVFVLCSREIFMDWMHLQV